MIAYMHRQDNKSKKSTKVAAIKGYKSESLNILCAYARAIGAYLYQI